MTGCQNSCRNNRCATLFGDRTRSVQYPRKQVGFTLIEVLIAAAIIVAAFTVLFQLTSQGLENLDRAGKVAQQVLIEKQIVYQVSMLNPAQQPEGAGRLVGAEYSWRAALRSPLLPVRDPSQLSRKRIGLYAIQVTIQYDDGDESRMELSKIGWEG